MCVENLAWLGDPRAASLVLNRGWCCAESVPGGGNGILIKRLSWILSFSFSHIQSKEDLFVAQLT